MSFMGFHILCLFFFCCSSCKKETQSGIVEKKETPGKTSTKIKPSNNWQKISYDIHKLPDDDLRKLVVTLRNDASSDDDKWRFCLAIEEFAARFPEEALELFEPKKMQSEDRGFEHLLYGMVKSKPELVVKWLKANCNEFSKEAKWDLFYQTCMTLSANEHGVMALEIYDFADKNMDIKSMQNEFIMRIFSDYARQNARAAEKAARMRFSEGITLDYALYHVSIGAKNPMEAYAIAQTIQSLEWRGQAVGYALNCLITTDEKTAINELMKQSPEMLQTAMFQDYDANLIKQLAATNATALTALLSKIAVTSENKEVFATAIQQMMKKSPQQASSLINGMPDSPIKNELIGTRFKALAERDRESALTEAAQMNAGDAKKIAYENIAKISGEETVQTILKNYETVPDEQKKFFLGIALEEAIAKNGNEVAELLTKQNELAKLDEGKIQDLIFATAKQYIDVNDAANIKTWLNRIPANYQTQAMRGLAKGMIANNVEGLSAFLTSLPNGNVKSAGIEVLLNEFRISNPQFVKTWEEKLQQSNNK